MCQLLSGGKKGICLRPIKIKRIVIIVHLGEMLKKGVKRKTKMTKETRENEKESKDENKDGELLLPKGHVMRLDMGTQMLEYEINGPFGHRHWIFSFGMIVLMAFFGISVSILGVITNINTFLVALILLTFSISVFLIGIYYLRKEIVSLRETLEKKHRWINRSVEREEEKMEELSDYIDELLEENKNKEKAND